FLPRLRDHAGFHANPPLARAGHSRAGIELDSQIFGETVIRARQAALQLLREILGEKIAEKRRALLFRHSEKMHADHIVRKHAPAGDAMAAALDLIEQGETNLGQLRQILRELRDAEGRFENRSTEPFDQVRESHRRSSLYDAYLLGGLDDLPCDW